MAEKQYRSGNEIIHAGKTLDEILEAHRAWLFREDGGSRASLEQAELSRADMRDVCLAKADLLGANLSNANLTKALFINSRLVSANLVEANLSGANLDMADLTSAKLRRTDLARSVLLGVNFYGADLAGANLTECSIGYTIFANCDLSATLGLETVQHNAPSTVGIDTILKSKGKIPESFLRGTGMPDIWIEYTKSLVTNPIEFYSCFISHSSGDDDFVAKLHAMLLDQGLRCWHYRRDAKWGKLVQADIGIAIYNYDKVIVVCSEASLNNAKVIDEIQRAIQREDEEKKEILFPIMIDKYLFGKWANKDWEAAYKSRLTKYWVGDFTDWTNPRVYNESLERLVSALNRKQPD